MLVCSCVILIPFSLPFATSTSKADPTVLLATGLIGSGHSSPSGRPTSRISRVLWPVCPLDGMLLATFWGCVLSPMVV